MGVAPAEALKPHLVKATGPLIRVLGDRYPSEVKAAIVRALLAQLDKGGPGLKAFAPQLQTTLVKCLADPSKTVRTLSLMSVCCSLVSGVWCQLSVVGCLLRIVPWSVIGHDLESPELPRVSY